jgi:signal transduction histidine kinase
LLSNKHQQLLALDFDAIFDDTTALAVNICNCTFVQINVTGFKKHWRYSNNKFSTEIIDIIAPMVALTLKQKEYIEIADLPINDYFNQNQVKHKQDVSYFAGIPLQLCNGDVVGTLCVMDNKSSAHHDQHQAIMHLLANNIITNIELQIKNAQLNSVTKLNELILASTPDLISIKNENFHITQANEAFIRQYPEACDPPIIERIESNKEQNTISEIIENIELPTGDISLFSTKHTHFKNSRGAMSTLSFSRDISVQEELNKLHNTINTDIDEFTSIVSHDLKSPLNAIKNLASWIKEDTKKGMTDDNDKYFEMMDKSVNRMTRLLEDLGHYSKVGRDNEPAKTMQLKLIVTECCDYLVLSKKFIINVVDCEITLPKPTLLLILQHLISNAVKHHDKDHGVITVGCISSKNGYQLSVTDDGPGISPAFHEKIFRIFQTLKSNDELEASGLGLAIIQKALKPHAGKITVKSQVGIGTTFTVNWPLDSQLNKRNSIQN